MTVRMHEQSNNARGNILEDHKIQMQKAQKYISMLLVNIFDYGWLLYLGIWQATELFAFQQLVTNNNHNNWFGWAACRYIITPKVYRWLHILLRVPFFLEMYQLYRHSINVYHRCLLLPLDMFLWFFAFVKARYKSDQSFL